MLLERAESLDVTELRKLTRRLLATVDPPETNDVASVSSIASNEQPTRADTSPSLMTRQAAPGSKDAAPAKTPP